MSKLEELQEKDLSSGFLSSKEESLSIYSVPENYFQEFPSKLKNQINYFETFEKVSFDIKESPFSIPKSYFDSFPEFILNQIRTAESFDKRMKEVRDIPYEIPRDYFQHFEIQLLKKLGISEEINSVSEVESISALLSGLKNKQPFSIPNKYFEETPKKKVSNTVEFEIPKKNKKRIIPKWIAAASVAFLILIAGLQMNSNSGSVHSEEYYEQALSQIPTEEIQEYLNLASNDIEGISSTNVNNDLFEKFDQLSIMEIQNYLMDGM